MDEEPKCDMCGAKCAAHHPDMPSECECDKETCTSCATCSAPATPAV